MVNFGEVRRAQLAKSTLLTSSLGPGIFSNLLRSVQILKREWGRPTESNGKLQHLFIPSKTAILFPEFAVGDQILSRTATLVSEFAVEDLPSDRTLDDYDENKKCRTCVMR